MSDDAVTDVDPNALKSDLEEIKGAIGLAEDHPYWWRFWIVEGVSVGLFFTIAQFWFRGSSGPLIAGTLVAILAVDYAVKRRLKSSYEPPMTGLPSQRFWMGAVLVGIGALVVGLIPVFEALEGTNAIRLALVSAVAVVGTAYLLMGQLLSAYNIRAADRYAFYAGGAWMLVLAAAIPHISAFEGWEYAVLGIGIALQHVAVYVVLARR
ncbi:hypothetical protein [Natronorubrum tibetense]|uniref:Uncharacterized protein n=1 Tax=Natronorubrum tibetense GA33 TaxID=1114856 RepID=L9W0U0_9EURY|nr:hypothetical protein [Natronorubrum tibetense]ELY42921.1 hypothetical protein C496_06292 [Natronorubrum tibetense GA33]